MTLERTRPKGPRKNHFPFSAADASHLAALLVGRILPVYSLLEPCNGPARHEYDAQEREPLSD